MIGRLLELWADENGVIVESTKSWTLKRAGKKAGVEPDESWVVGDRPSATLPDVALEVVHTHGGLSKLELYARLGVREAWFWVDGELSVHTLRGGRYVRAREVTSSRRSISSCSLALPATPHLVALHCCTGPRCERRSAFTRRRV